MNDLNDWMCDLMCDTVLDRTLSVLDDRGINEEDAIEIINAMRGSEYKTLDQVSESDLNIFLSSLE